MLLPGKEEVVEEEGAEAVGEVGEVLIMGKGIATAGIKM